MLDITEKLFGVTVLRHTVLFTLQQKYKKKLDVTQLSNVLYLNRDYVVNIELMKSRE